MKAATTGEAETETTVPRGNWTGSALATSVATTQNDQSWRAADCVVQRE